MLNKTIFSRRIIRSLVKATVLLFILTFFAGCGTGWEIENPYESVDWENDGRYKGNFHTHTTVSDGRLNPHTVVDKYNMLDYDILAIADHNSVTYPWTEFSEMEPSNLSINRMEDDPESMPDYFNFEDRDPSALGIIDIQANELSSHHHMGSFFNDHNNTRTEIESLDAIEEKGGISMLYHPGRYDKPVEWYTGLYFEYDHLIGLEVYNAGDRYPEDRKIWDSILTQTMPERPVWGFSNDDMHTEAQLGRNWNILILPELTHESVRHGMENGLSYFVYAPEGHDGPPPPVIESVNVNNRRGIIEISATGYDSMLWISNGEIVYEGSSINLDKLMEDARYVRAKLFGAGDVVIGTQPFGIKKP